MSTEIWKTVNDFPEYEVSNLGRVKSIRFDRVLKPYPAGRNGNLQVSLCRAGVTERRTVHHLVAEHFMDVAVDGYRVRFIDGDVKNVKLTNLTVDHTQGVAGRGVQSRGAGRSLVSERVLSRFDI